MQNPFRFKASMLATTLALMSFNAAQAVTLSKTEFSDGKTRIANEYKADKAACDAMKANAKDICVEQAKAKEKSARADLESAYSGKPADVTKARVVKADGAYAVAKEMCDDRSGNEKDVCVKEAKATHVKAVSEAKMVKKVSDARSDAAADVRSANYKVAAQKCDAMTGAAMTSCVDAAKAKYGQ